MKMFHSTKLSWMEHFQLSPNENILSIARIKAFIICIISKILYSVQSEKMWSNEVKLERGRGKFKICFFFFPFPFLLLSLWVLFKHLICLNKIFVKSWLSNETHYFTFFYIIMGYLNGLETVYVDGTNNTNGQTNNDVVHVHA